MLQLRKLTITELPLNLIATMTEVELEDWAVNNQLNRMGSWLLPQLVAAFGAWKLILVEGKPDVKLTLKHNCEASLENQALWRLSRIPRTLLLTKQIAQAEYATLTPLVLAGFKRMQGVGYETWKDCAGLDYILEPRLFEAVTCTVPNLGSERLLEIRTQGLTTSILTQIWLAHPVHRSNLMILDPHDWDHMPEPLIAPTIFKQPVKESVAINTKETAKTLLPWM